MAFETNALVNGAWTTQTLDVNTVLRHYDQQDREANERVEIERTPVLGLLTQTVIRSALAHWILPARIRNSVLNDVAFIGDNFVQIKELRTDGHLWDVICKENFGARIRNVTVIGSVKAYDQEFKSQNDGFLSPQIKDEDEDIDMDLGEGPKAPSRDAILPPQFLLLQLDTGDTVFLMLQQSKSGAWEFVSNRHRVSKSMIKLEAGTHLAVDPSSRYIAVGCSEGLFAIYSLRSREELKRQHSDSSRLRYVGAERHIYLQGIIHKMEFLYPAADDEAHIILLILVIFKGKTRMLLYEWQTGADLQSVRSHSRKGHLLEECRQMPLLVIPLTIQSSFILVTETSMAICTDIVAGSPRIVDFNTVVDDPTPFHHGIGSPLWTSWTRPIRRVEHAAIQDDIYIVREDGQVQNVEIHSVEDLMNNNIGTFQSNCGTALASLEYDGTDARSGELFIGDLLITGGDSCSGGVYLIKARKEPQFRQTIQNWSPAHDLITTSTRQDHDSTGLLLRHRGKQAFPKPDKLYACVGKGIKGAIVELRRGFEGHIGLEMEFHTPIIDVWVLPSEFDSVDTEGGSNFLLSLGDSSALLQLSGDASAVHEVDESSTLFDLRYRTITASAYSFCLIQVTEKSIVFIDGPHTHIQEGSELLSIYDSGTLLGCGTEIAVAAIAEATVVFTIILGGQTFLLVQHFAIPNAQASQGTSNHPVNTDAQTLANFSTRITSIAVCQVKQLSCAIVTQWTGHSTVLTFQPIDGSMPHSVNIPETLGDGNHAIEEIVSIVTSTQSPGGLLVLCGTRNGVVVMLQLNEDSFEVAHCQYDHIGATPAILRKDNHIGKELFFVNTDSKVFAFAPAITSRYGFEPGILTGRTINQIWLTDVMNPGRQQPNINSLARLPINTSTGAANAIILVDGSQLFIAGLSTLPKAVPRQIPIGGTPSRLLYSHGLEVIIVGAVVNGKSTLMFVDPESGSDLSKCWDKQNNIETDSVGGLGYHNERIFRLFEWPFVKDGKTWNFIIVCTSAGRLLMISTEKEKDNHTPGHRETRTRPSIRYWTRYKWKCESPIYSAVGSDDGIFYCCGKTLNYETLDLTEKKFKKVAQYELPSAALNLIYENGKIYALTSVHSLEILELTGPTRSNFVRTHGDQITRNSLHNRVIGPSSDHPLHLISDKECSVVGLLATPNTRADTLEPVFEAELPHSILRFRYGSCRPVWDPTWWSSDKAQNGTSDVMDARSAIDYPEILGLSIDGSLCHFTVLNFTTWNFLRFLVNLALQSPRVCEFTYEGSDALKMQLQPATEPKLMMHVNGDILRRCLEERRLEELLGLQNAEVGGKIQTKFRELIEALHRGRLGKNSAMSTLVERAYEDLEFFLRPVL